MEFFSGRLVASNPAVVESSYGLAEVYYNLNFDTFVRGGRAWELELALATAG